MKELHHLAVALVVVGALNWGLVGLLGLNLVESVLGMGTLTKVVYVVVGLAGVKVAWMHWGASRKGHR